MSRASALAVWLTASLILLAAVFPPRAFFHWREETTPTLSLSDVQVAPPLPSGYTLERPEPGRWVRQGRVGWPRIFVLTVIDMEQPSCIYRSCSKLGVDLQRMGLEMGLIGMIGGGLAFALRTNHGR